MRTRLRKTVTAPAHRHGKGRYVRTAAGGQTGSQSAYAAERKGRAAGNGRRRKAATGGPRRR